jgi:hypothetical protein
VNYIKHFAQRAKWAVPRFRVSILVLVLVWAGLAQAQTCLGSDDMEPATETALVHTAETYFEMVARGDSATLQQNAISGVAGNFSGIETAIRDNQSNLAGAKAVARPPYLLQAEGTAPLARAEFLCGVFGPSGQTANSAVFEIPNLPPGNYGFVTQDVSTSQGPYTIAYVLQQEENAWKLGGLYIKPTQVAGHDGDWFAERARAFKTKGANLTAWLYYAEARDLLVPVPFMSTMVTDKLYDESQTVKPSDLPPSDLAVGAKTYQLTALYPLAVANDFDLVVKYQSADVSNAAATYQVNVAVMKALLAKHPELRNAFDGVIARAVEPSGRDYGTMLIMKDIK